MAQDCAEVRVGLTGRLFAAPVGTPMPADVVTDLAAPWVDLGFTNEDGISLSSDTDREDFTVWQSIHPCRSVVTGQVFTSTFTLVQRNPGVLAVAFGGGEVTVDNGIATFVPPPAGLNEFAFVYEIVDGPIIDRYLLYRGSPALGGEVNFQRGEMTGYEIEVTHLNTVDGVWRLLSNDPALLGDDGGIDDFAALLGMPENYEDRGVPVAQTVGGPGEEAPPEAPQPESGGQA